MAEVNRRQFLERAAMIGAGLSAAALLGGCKAGGGGTDCSDVSALSETELASRTTSNYVERSPHAAKTCANCALYTGTADSCGVCSVVRGPIKAAGYCDLWVAAS